MPPKMNLTVRAATIEDCGLIHHFTTSLAEFEHALDKVEATVTSFQQTLFGPHPYAHVLFACDNGTAVGMALYFFNYSTWKGRPGLYLEDLVIAPEYRSRGVGTMLMSHVARVAVEKGCGRMEWAALDWNTPAIDFYVHKVKARQMSEWVGFRLENETLTDFAALASASASST
ncbi:GCN5-related N-acetyltransferase [Powellomyces hirtus]|nr:GCN5-related N-acetyltransferase [Powellomyces hirtus]